MVIAYDGEILLKEKYGSARERFYVKPPEQRNIAILEDDQASDVANWLTKIFLPQGYPDSVSKDYIAYQIWDTAQAFCSTITGTLATQEVLRGVGVGDTTATPLAATVTWVVKDGCGHLGKIIFAYSHGTQLDAYSKKWRLYADVINDAAMCIEMTLPLFKDFITFVLCISSVMKAIVGVTGGATRAAMTQHHAVRGNMADVAAKDSAQETAVNLIASFTALAIITLFGNSLLIFAIMMVLHIVFNYLAVRAVCLRTLNEPRYLHLIDRYIRQEVIAAPCEINQNEPVIFSQMRPNRFDIRMTGFQIHMGCSMKKMAQSMKASHLKSVLEIYSARNYILHLNVNERNTYVFIKEEASTDDVLCAYFHAVLLSIITSALNDDCMGAFEFSDEISPFVQMCRTLQQAEWTRRNLDRQGLDAHEPSYELLRFADEIACNEWRRIQPALKQTGWDLSKHLLIVDEWRIFSKNNNVSETNIDVISPSSRIVSFDVSQNRNFLAEKGSYTIEPESHVEKTLPKKKYENEKIFKTGPEIQDSNSKTDLAHTKED